MDYSIKKRNAVFWKTGFSPEQVQSKFTHEGNQDDWLICPHGDAEQAIAVETFLQTPGYFERLAEKRRQESKPELNQSQDDVGIESAILSELREIHGWIKFIGIVVIVQIAIWLISLLASIAG